MELEPKNLLSPQVNILHLNSLFYFNVLESLYSLFWRILPPNIIIVSISKCKRLILNLTSISYGLEGCWDAALKTKQMSLEIHANTALTCFNPLRLYCFRVDPGHWHSQVPWCWDWWAEQQLWMGSGWGLSSWQCCSPLETDIDKEQGRGRHVWGSQNCTEEKLCCLPWLADGEKSPEWR